MGGSGSRLGSVEGSLSKSRRRLAMARRYWVLGRESRPGRWWLTRGSEGSTQQGPREGGSRGGRGSESRGRESAGWATYGWVSGAGRWALGICFAISRAVVLCRLSVVVSLEERAININFPRLINSWQPWERAATGTALRNTLGGLRQRDQTNRTTPFASGVGPRPAGPWRA